MKANIFILILGIISISYGCKKLVVVDSPPTKFDSSKAYSSDGNAIAVLTSIYQEMSNNGVAQGVNSISFLCGLAADELIDYQFGAERTAAYQNKISSFNVPFWNRMYFLIYTANTAIEGIETSKTLSPTVKQRLLGEAKFIRAFYYFYLVNLWGDIPLALTNDFNINNIAKRSSSEIVYKQIILDLNEAIMLLGPDYLLSDLKTPTSERIRPNQWAAKALLSRTYLFIKDYQNALKVSTEIIDNKALFDLTPLAFTFLKNSKEGIWQIQPISSFWNTYDARGFVLRSAPTSMQPVSISTQLLSSFEPGDGRKIEWVGNLLEGGKNYSFPNKYKNYADNSPITEYLMVFRISEQYLIRAEARMQLGDLTGAINDVNLIRKRSRMPATIEVPNPLPDLPLNLSKPELEKAILHERQVEMFTEWGHRWLDLKRTGEINAVMQIVTPQKGGTWNMNKSLFPIPFGDLRVNTNLTQNPGY